MAPVPENEVQVVLQRLGLAASIHTVRTIQTRTLRFKSLFVMRDSSFCFRGILYTVFL
jgi:hypothetical protein